MALVINYGNQVVTLPATAMEALKRAGETDIKLLTALCTDRRLLETASDDLPLLARALSCSTSAVAASIAFWRGVGVLKNENETDEHEPEPMTTENDTGTENIRDETAQSASTVPAENGSPEENESASAKPESPGVRKVMPKDKLPNYSADEIAEMIEKNQDVSAYLQECQQVWGKVFNTHEVNLLLGLSDYLGMDWGYIIMLLSSCRRLLEKRGHAKSLHYVETTAFNLYETGVLNVIDLQEYFRRFELFDDATGKLRTLLGIGTRTLSAKEKQFFSQWLYDYQFDFDIIRLAFDKTVNATGKSSISYMNAILKKWSDAALKTVEEVEKYEELHKNDAADVKSTSRKTPKGRKNDSDSSSFESSEFFDDAVKRNFDSENQDK